MIWLTTYIVASCALGALFFALWYRDQPGPDASAGYAVFAVLVIVAMAISPA